MSTNKTRIQQAEERLAKLKQAEAEKAYKVTFAGMLDEKKVQVVESLVASFDKLATIEGKVESHIGKGAPESMKKALALDLGSDKVEAKIESLNKEKSDLASMELKKFASVVLDDSFGEVAKNTAKLVKAKAKNKTLVNQAKIEGLDDCLPSEEYKKLNYDRRKLVAFLFRKEGLPLSSYSASSGIWEGSKFKITIVK
jgi:hypothetical protein